MKKYIFILICIFVICLSSCSDNAIVDDISMPQTLSKNQSKNQKVYKSISFSSEKEYEDAYYAISHLSTEEEKANWVKENYPTFYSMHDLYSDAMDEMASYADVTKEIYQKFEDKYCALYFPHYLDDAGFYIPMSDLNASYLVNPNGEVSISDKVKNLIDISDYYSLVNLGRAFYSTESNLTRGDAVEFYLTSTSMNSVGPEYDSGWKEYGDRKVKLKARRRFETINLSPQLVGSHSLIHLEFCFRKKTWLGWSNYKCKSTISFQFNLFGRGWYGPIIWDHNSTSSHDSEMEYPIIEYNAGDHYVYSFVEAPCTATINFADISSPLNYNWTMPGLFAKAGSAKVLILPQYIP